MFQPRKRFLTLGGPVRAVKGPRTDSEVLEPGPAAGYKSTMECRRSVRYTGRVQGVGFRFTARSIASGQALTGWVRNEADGSVQLQVQGSAAEVDAFLASVRERMGRWITAEAVQDMESLDGESGFQVRS